MRQLIYTYIILAVTIVLTSCSKQQYQYLFQQKNSAADTSSQQATDNQNHYIIKVQDILQIKNLQNSKNLVDLNPSIAGGAVVPTNTSQDDNYLVEDDGTVPLTGLGRIKLAGLTRVQSQKLIEDLYHKTLLKDPIIQIKIINLNVIFFGEVKATGTYPLPKERTSLVQMIGIAGGLTEKANETNIKIIRGTQKNPQVIQIDLSNIQSINDPKAVLQSGDIIYVEQNRRAIRNDNFLNLSQIIQPALLLFNTALIVLTFIHR